MMNRVVRHSLPGTMSRPSPALRPWGRNAFSIVELLIVVGIVVILLSIVVVAVNSAARSAQRSNTQALMNSLRQGLIQFESEMGYLPPVLDHRRNLMFDDWDSSLLGEGPCPRPLSVEPSSSEREAYQHWYSVTTLAEYLVGYGDVTQVGHNGLGIRHPGNDGYWGASRVYDCMSWPNPGQLNTRMDFLNPNGGCASVSKRYREGQVYGPYIEIQDDRLIGSIDPSNPWLNEAAGIYAVHFPGESGYNDNDPKVIVDYWGQPIRYYRLPYAGTNPAQEYRPRPHALDFRVPRLSDFFALRPYQVRDREVTDGLADMAGNTTTTLQLQTARFGMLSPGPNRSVNQAVIVDEEEFNADNIVELGP